MKLIFDLINKGFNPFRKVGSDYKPCDNPSWFSSVEIGKVDVRLVIGDKEIVIGLFQKGCPPTLIYPNLIKDKWITSENGKVEINRSIERALRKTTIDEIIELA